MEKRIEIIALPQAEEFLDTVEEKVRKKFFHAFRKTQQRIFGNWFKKLTGTDELYEFRVDDNGKFYRLFAFWDSRGADQTLIITSHGLIKKSNKTPKSELEKAEKIKQNYFKE
ncbi:MAG: type II toxin-antitoxin system RelE/ParE family toxin [Paludibacter sp.]|nr:type II toxin-antitoxin system RelE/ParE family toxin [Paludibacter sp.]